MKNLVSGVAVLTLAFTCTAAISAPLKGETPAHTAQLAQVWAQIGKLPNLWEGTWQGISDLYMFPPPVEYTSKAAAFVKGSKGVEDTTQANCTNPGMPFVMHQGAMPIKFLPSPDLIAIYIETFAVTRFIHMDGREFPADLNPTYLGTSIGHWEGETLVVDSRGFVDEVILQVGFIPGTGTFGQPILMQHGPDLRFVERMRMRDQNTLEIETTIHDDTIFAKPYTSTREWHRYTGTRSDPQEWVCSENRDYYDPAADKLHYGVKPQPK